jgi:hypothetical protein
MRNCGGGIARDGAVARQELLTRAAIIGLRTAIIVLILSFVTSKGFSQPPSPPESSKPPDQAKPPEQTTPPQQSAPPEQTKPPEQTTPNVVTQAENAALQPVKLFNLLQKKSIVFPDIAASTVALTPTEKFKLFVDNSISVHTVAWALVGSGIGQAADSPTGFSQGWGGYGKRFGTAMIRQSTGQFFGTFMLASALHEDPRFFPEYNPTLKHAVKYSLRRLFITRNDDGQPVKNVSGLAGPLMGEALANAYWPDRNRTAGDTLLRYGLDLASQAAGNMFREYWPVLLGKMLHEPPQQSDPH